MDLLKIFRMPEPVSKELLTKNSQLSHYKEEVQEKDVLVKNHLARIKELEKEISELKARQREMENQLRASNLDENDFHKVMVCYDNFIKRIWEERHNLRTERTILENHISNLENAFQKLIEKYQKSTAIVELVVTREGEMNMQIEAYKQLVEDLKSKFEALKQHSESMLAEANLEMDNREKGNIQEVAKLKAKILERQAKINELQKHGKVENFYTRQSIFEPLRNNILKK